jgi:hypothetical protein
MKKITTVFVVCILSIWTATSQDFNDDPPEKKWSFGIKAGIQYNEYNGAGLEEGSSGAASFHIGGLVEYKLSGKFSLQSEAVFMRNGNFFENVDMNNTLSVAIDGELTVDYLNIPLLAKYYIKRGWSIEAGPQLGIRIGERQQVESLFEDGTMTTENETAYLTSGVNLSVGLGTTYEFSNGIFASARYVRGITNESTRGSDLKVKNENFQLSVGYKF